MFLSPSAESLEVNTLGDGSSTLLCSAQNVVDMHWKVTVSEMRSTVYSLDEILDSAEEDILVTEGITLSSTVSPQSLERIKSTMSVAPSSDDGRRVRVTFVCSGSRRSGETFRNRARVTAILPVPTTTTANEQETTPPGSTASSSPTMTSEDSDSTEGTSESL